MSSTKFAKKGTKSDDCDGCVALNAMKQATATSSRSGASTLAAPPDINELGKSTWTLLHTMAAYYPNTPSPETQQHTTQFLYALSNTFPCKWCADDFKQSLSAAPPRVESRQAFGLWLCQQHNQVNEKLGKPQFDCSLIDKRWKREI